MLRLGFFPDEKINKDAVYRLLARFVTQHSSSMKRPAVEGTKGHYVFATRQNCLMYFMIDWYCPIYGSMLIDVVYGEYEPAVEAKINRQETRFSASELTKFKMFEHPFMNVSLSLMDYRFDEHAFNVFKKCAQRNNLGIDIYDGAYPDGSVAKACSLEMVIKNIDTQGEFEKALEDMYVRSQELLCEIAEELGLMKEDIQKIHYKNWKSL